MSTSSTDVVLIEFMGEDAPALNAALKSLLKQLGGNAQAFRAVEEPRVTVYVRHAKTDTAAVRPVAQKALGGLVIGEVEVSRLESIRKLPGASAGTSVDYHYIVRTDVAEGGAEDLERWYDNEHLQGLANVPGVTMAERLISHDAGPKYYAGYDILQPGILQTPQWLAVRDTEWSARVRPTFRNTRRIVSRRLEL